MIWTLQEAQDNLKEWKLAYKAAMSGKAYTIENRSITRQDLAQIKKELQYWSDIINQLTSNNSSSRLKRVVMVDL